MQHLDDALIAEWVDGAIPPQSPHHAAIAAHVDQCDECRVRVDEERALAGHVRQLLGVAAPPERVPPFAEVLHRAGSAPKHAASPRFPWRRLAWAATVVVAGGVGWYARGALIGSRRDGPTGVAQVASREPAAAPTEAALPEAARVPPVAVAESPAVGGIARREEVAAAGPGGQAAQAREAVANQVVTAEAQAADERVAARRDAGPPAAPSPADARSLAQVSGAAENELRAQKAAVHVPWTVTTRSDAERVLGHPLLSVSTLPVAGIDLASDSSAVRVRQPLGDGATLELVQFPEAATDAAMGRAAVAGAVDEPRERSAPGTPSVLGSVVDGVRVVVSAPVTLDSLRVLLGKTRR